MKKAFKSFRLGVILTSAFLLWTNVDTALAGSGSNILDIVKTSVIYLEAMDETIASIQIDNLSKSSTTSSYTRYLYSGNTYTAVATGDANFSDIDMVVYKRVGSSWTQVGKDADTSNTAVVTFECNSSGEYKFEIKAYRFSSESSNGYYGFILSF